MSRSRSSKQISGPPSPSPRVGPARANGLAAQAVLAAIDGYRLLLGPVIGGTCRFVPSCSAYASDAVVRHGALRGSWMAVRRVARCHPLGGYGLDPVDATTEKGD